MEDADRKKLTSNLVTLSEDLDLDIVLPFLRQHDVLKESHLDSIKNKTTKFESRQELIFILQRRGPDAFRLFCDALNYAGQDHLVHLLNGTTASSNISVKNPETNVPIIKKQNLPGPTRANISEVIPSKSEHSIEENGAVSLPKEEPTLILPKSSFHSGRCLSQELKGVLEELISVDVPDRAIPDGFNPQEIYPNFSRPKGHVLIINNKYFKTEYNGLKPRLGTEIDEKNLVNLFKNRLGYAVHVHNDLTAEDMGNTLNRFAKLSDHLNCDSAIVVVLSHGEDGYIHGSGGLSDVLPVKFLIECFNAQNCPNLVNKPKIIILQACRGNVGVPPVTVTDGRLASSSFGKTWRSLKSSFRKIFWNQADAINESPSEISLATAAVKDRERVEEEVEKAIRAIPTNADFLIAYSTCSGYVSFRRKETGSWFIQAICEIFNKGAFEDVDIVKLFIKVNSFVADRICEAEDTDYHRTKQMPDINVRLLRDFYFFPGIYKEPTNEEEVDAGCCKPC